VVQLGRGDKVGEIEETLWYELMVRWEGRLLYHRRECDNKLIWVRKKTCAGGLTQLGGFLEGYC